MAFDTISSVLSASVATAGTFTVGYPSGRSAGSYVGSYAHKAYINGTLFSAPVDFSLSFDASSITVTWNGTTTLASGSAYRLQVDILGADDSMADRVVLPANVARAPLFRVNLGSPVVGAASAISASQSVAAAASFLLNGTTAGVLDVPRNVIAAWTTTSILTITGKDAAGNTVVEKSASGASHTGKKAFKSITSITSSASITSATVGTGNVLGMPVVVPDAESIVEEWMDGVASPRPPSKVFLPYEIEETELLAGTAEQIVCPVAGWISKIRGIVQGAVTTGAASTVEVNTVAVVGLTYTVVDADAVGVRYSDAPTTRHSATTVVAAGDRITVTPGAAFGTAGQLNGVLEIDVSAAGQLDGTFVKAVASAATATTGDTRGTYSPSVTPDGAVAYSLVLRLADPGGVGVPQYTG